jgi:hypothetical protein
MNDEEGLDQIIKMVIVENGIQFTVNTPVLNNKDELDEIHRNKFIISTILKNGL